MEEILSHIELSMPCIVGFWFPHLVLARDSSSKVVAWTQYWKPTNHTTAHSQGGYFPLSLSLSSLSSLFSPSSLSLSLLSFSFSLSPSPSGLCPLLLCSKAGKLKQSSEDRQETNFGEKFQALWWRWRKLKQKSIYVTVRVNPHVPGPMETRNKKAAKEVCEKTGCRVCHPQKFPVSQQVNEAD